MNVNKVYIMRLNIFAICIVGLGYSGCKKDQAIPPGQQPAVQTPAGSPEPRLEVNASQEDPARLVFVETRLIDPTNTHWSSPKKEIAMTILSDGSGQKDLFEVKKPKKGKRSDYWILTDLKRWIYEYKHPYGEKSFHMSSNLVIENFDGSERRLVFEDTKKDSDIAVSSGDDPALAHFSNVRAQLALVDGMLHIPSNTFWIDLGWSIRSIEIDTLKKRIIRVRVASPIPISKHVAYVNHYDKDGNQSVARIDMRSGKVTILPKEYNDFDLEHGSVSTDGKVIMLRKRTQEFNRKSILDVSIHDAAFRVKKKFGVNENYKGSFIAWVGPYGKWIYWLHDDAIRRTRVSTFPDIGNIDVTNLLEKSQIVYLKRRAGNYIYPTTHIQIFPVTEPNP